MKTIALIFTVFIMMIGLQGCAQPQPFNQYNKSITFIDGKPYLTPFGTTHRQVDAKAVEMNRYLGVMKDCYIGDAIWTEINTYNSFDKVFAGKDENTIKQIAIQYVNSGLVGCSKTMSDQEYQYYLAQTNMQQEQLAIQRQQTINSLNQSMQNLNNNMRQNADESQQMLDNLNQKRQDKKNNYQLQQINNNLNGIRYGY